MGGEHDEASSEVADGSSYRETDDPGAEAADGSSYRDEQKDHPLHEDRVDPDGVIEQAREEEREREGNR